MKSQLKASWVHETAHAGRRPEGDRINVIRSVLMFIKDDQSQKNAVHILDFHIILCYQNK